ncbi:response regulator transcription factor [Telmatospirillum sp.]|uniref:response regulator transcription factor n=1 Tax=Telmatospirillum sp. TaxID=2079197 RepID=UPI00284B9383|nr:response regulator transcription factor [Telmatospirillum sp.]MDR3440508.1 response regulator transcription factor [Telmatospirillum sp.]
MTGLRDDGPKTTPPTPRTDDTRAAPTISIFIVEDKAEFLDEFSRMLSSAPDLHLVATATTLAEGLARLEGAPVDVLLVDLGLPDGSGLDLIREIARRPAWRDSCEIMVVSVFADEAHVMAAIEAGASGYLVKDSSPASFIQQIRELHAGGSPISPVIARKLLARLGAASSSENTPAAPSPERASLAVELAESERMVLHYASRGYTYDEVAKLMGVTRHTVLSYVKRSYLKLQVHSKTEALYEARRMGLVRD